MWPVDRSVAQDPADTGQWWGSSAPACTSTFISTIGSSVVHLIAMKISISHLRASIEGTVGRKQNIDLEFERLQVQHSIAGFCGRRKLSRSLFARRVANVHVGTGQLTWRAVQVILQFDLILWLRTRSRYGGG